MVNPTQELMLISVGGIVLRTEVEQISLQGRPTQGVTLMDVEGGDAVASVTVIDMTTIYKEEASLPTGASAKPKAPGDGKRRDGRKRPAGAKAAGGDRTPSAKAKTAPPAASAKGKKPAAKASKTAPAKSRRTAPSAKAQAGKPGSRPTKPSAGPQRKPPRKGR